ncbi:MAG: hypothetical protein JSS40_16100 [Proteobacteria bacterium]|nr:hypothetical protein [Pseudomonadota bacterium]
MWRLIVVLAMFAVLPGCTALQLGYNNADALIHWRGGKYFGFEGEQKAEFERRVQHFLAWHRKSELPKYASFANTLGDRLARGISQTDLVWGYDSFQALLRQTLRAAAAESGELLDTLSAAQLERFQARLEKENRDFAKDHALADPPEERRARRVRRNIERLEDWFGALTDAQIERVRLYSARAPLDDELRDQDRKRMQRELVAMFNAKLARSRLVQWAAAWDQNRDPLYETLRKENLREYFSMLLDLDRTLSPEQRSRAVQRLRGFAGDFTALVAAADGAR